MSGVAAGSSQPGHNIQDVNNVKNRDNMPLTGQQMLKKTIRLINSAAGAPLNKNFLDSASLDTLMIAIMSERAELLEDTLREQVQEVRSKNDKLKGANSIIAKARAAKKGSKESKETKVPQEVLDFFDANDIAWNEDDTKEQSLNSGEWDLAIENLKGWSESLTSTSQLDMNKLQATSGRFNQTFETMSQFISKYYRTNNQIIRNI